MRNNKCALGSKQEVTTIIDARMKVMVSHLICYIKEGHYKEILLTMGNTKDFSFSNQMMIFIQKPQATIVKGIHFWNSVGRHIIAGEKGIKIFAPITHYNNNQFPPKVEIIGFKTVYVFDYSQTQGKSLITYQSNCPFLNNKCKDYCDVLSDYMANHYQISVTFVSEDKMDVNMYGKCNFKKKTIEISDQISDEKKLSTLIHECSHILLRIKITEENQNGNYFWPNSWQEIAAESIACIVSKNLGLNTEQFSFPYVASWSKNNPSQLIDLLPTISEISKHFIAILSSESVI